MDEQQVNITTSVHIDSATEKILNFIAGNNEYTPDILCIAMERALLTLKDAKNCLYVSALLQKQQSEKLQKEDIVKKEGTIEELKQDLRANGIEVKEEDDG